MIDSAQMYSKSHSKVCNPEILVIFSYSQCNAHQILMNSNTKFHSHSQTPELCKQASLWWVMAVISALVSLRQVWCRVCVCVWWGPRGVMLRELLIFSTANMSRKCGELSPPARSRLLRASGTCENISLALSPTAACLPPICWSYATELIELCMQYTITRSLWDSELASFLWCFFSADDTGLFVWNVSFSSRGWKVLMNPVIRRGAGLMGWWEGGMKWDGERSSDLSTKAVW